MFRSKVNWMECGEKNTKYFFNLEKARYNTRTCKKIVMDDGSIIEDEKIILKEQYKYYADLYKRDDFVTFSIENTIGIEIDQNQYEMCSAVYKIDEVTAALKDMRKNKTPGDDGLSV